MGGGFFWIYFLIVAPSTGIESGLGKVLTSKGLINIKRIAAWQYICNVCNAVDDLFT